MELLDAINEIYVTCPDCEKVFRVNEGNPGTAEQYEPTFMEEQEDLLANLDEEWAKKVSEARVHQRAIGVARALEQISPLLPGYPRDFRDARFIGGIAPCDILSLDGYAKGKTESLTFIEVKTGKTARLKKTERDFKKVIDDGEMYHEILHIPLDELVEYLKDAPVKHKKAERK